MLLDRQADVHLAKRSAADAWVVKPLDALTLQRTVAAVLAGPAEPATEADGEAADGTWEAAAEEEEAVSAG